MKLINTEYTTYDIVNDFLMNNQSEQPFYIIDLGEIITLYEKWKTQLPTVIPYYAVKCNHNPVILEVLSELGTCFDCVSENEIKS